MNECEAASNIEESTTESSTAQNVENIDDFGVISGEVMQQDGNYFPYLKSTLHEKLLLFK